MSAVRYYVTVKGEERLVDLVEHEDGSLSVELDGTPVTADLQPLESSLHSLLLDGHSREMVLERDGDTVVVYLDGERIAAQVHDEVSRALSAIGGAVAAGASNVEAPMPGVIIGIPATVGDTIAVGQAVVVMEAMKMQNELLAESAGVVESIEVKVGDTVAGGDVLVKMKAVEE